MKPESAPQDPRTIVLFGVPFHDVTFADTIAWIDYLVATRKPSFFVTANLDFAVQASEDVELQRILMEAELVLCDGTPLIWASRLTGKPLRERVAGSDLAPRLAAHSEKMGYRIFLLGGAPDSLELAAARLQKDYPHLPQVHYYSPPFAPLQSMDNAEILARIQKAKPDILLVAFGCPKQEKWIYMHYRKLGVPVCIGVGATVDFLAGKFVRAPAWAGKLGIEWIYRLSQEPARLGGRYWKDFRFLVSQSLRETHAIRSDGGSSPDDPGQHAAKALPAMAAGEPGSFEFLLWAGKLTEARIDQFQMPSMRSPFVLDLSGITGIDSRGLGALLRVMRRAWSAGVPGCLLSPSQPVKMVVEVTKLSRVLPIAENFAEAKKLIESETASSGLHAVSGDDPGSLVFPMPARLTADNAEICASSIRHEWEKRSAARQLCLDLSQTRFMDSSGLGLLLRMQRMVRERAGAEFLLANLQDNIRNVIRVSRLEQVLLPGERKEKR